MDAQFKAKLTFETIDNKKVCLGDFFGKSTLLIFLRHLM